MKSTYKCPFCELYLSHTIFPSQFVCFQCLRYFTEEGLGEKIMENKWWENLNEGNIEFLKSNKVAFVFLDSSWRSTISRIPTEDVEILDCTGEWAAARAGRRLPGYTYRLRSDWVRPEEKIEDKWEREANEERKKIAEAKETGAKEMAAIAEEVCRVDVRGFITKEQLLGYWKEQGDNG